MLTKISESLNRENIQALAYICGIPFVHGNTSLQNLDVLIEFEKKGVISYDNVDPLIGLLTDVHRLDVAHDVKTYQEWSQHAGVQLTTSGSSTTLVSTVVYPGFKARGVDLDVQSLAYSGKVTRKFQSSPVCSRSVLKV